MRRLASIAFLCLVPGAAAADGFGIPGLPGFGTEDLGPRPSYRESYDAYPPPQHNFLGMPVPAPSPYDRPSYRESYDDFPPPAGRYGGGFIEYVITGGRMAQPATQLAPGYALAYTAPVYARRSYAPLYPPAVPAYEATAPAAARRLPRSSLPEYLPDQPAAR